MTYFWKRGNVRKKCGEIEYWGFSVLFVYWGFKKIPFTFYNYALAKMLQNSAKVIRKPSPGFKNYIWNSDKYTFLQLKHYTQRIYVALFSTTCVKFTKLSHIWNRKSFFMTQLLCIFLTQTLHTFYKSSPSKGFLKRRYVTSFHFLKNDFINQNVFLLVSADT